MKKKNFTIFAVIISVAILLTVFALTTELAAAAPTGTISINSGATYTTSRTVTLTLTYSALVYQMRFSEDWGDTWGPWVAADHTYIFTMADLGEGNRYVDVQFKEILTGSVSSPGAIWDSIILDTVKPTGTIVINSGDLYTDSRTVTLTLSGTDATSGPYKMRFSEDWGSTWGSWVDYAASYSYTLTSANDGLKYVDVQFQDKAGLVSSAGAIYDSTYLDTIAPTGSIVINSGDTYSNSESVTLSLTYSDVTSGVDKVRYTNANEWGSEPWETPTASIAWTLSSGDGIKYVSYQIRDNSGLISETYWDEIILDTTGPGTSVVSSSTHPDQDAYYSNNDPSFTWTIPADPSGIAGYSIGLSHFSFAIPDQVIDTTDNTFSYTDVEDGEWYFHVRAVDNAGNWGDKASYRIRVTTDTTPPTGSILINDGAASTTTASVTLSLTYSDLLSGVYQVRYSNDGTWDTEEWESPAATKAWTLTSGDGTKTVYYQIKDNAGLLSSTFSDDIILVTSGPDGSIVINNGDATTSSASVTLSLTYSDPVSAVSQVRYSNDGVFDTEEWESPAASKAWTLTSGDGEKTVYYQIKNAAELTNVYSDTIVLDSTAPTGSIIINNGDASVSSTSVTLSLTYSDASSGVYQVRYSNDGTWDTEEWESPAATKAWTLTSGDGTKTVYYQIKDNAGLVSTVYSDTITLQTPNPTPTPTSPPTSTPQPTNPPNPTSNPTSNPTAKPTDSPTDSPTANPTIDPTANPTASPTSQSTQADQPMLLYVAVLAVIVVAIGVSLFFLMKKRL